MLIVISGPSGAGKSTIVQRILKPLGLELSISATTRPQRKGEVNHRDYHFITRQEFERRIARDEFLEYAEYNGHLYGTPKAPVLDALAQGKDVLLAIDVQGARKIRAAYPDALTIFVTVPNAETLRQRLVARRRGEDKNEIERRLQIAQEEMKCSGEFQHVVVNDVLDDAVAQTQQIITRARQERAAH